MTVTAVEKDFDDLTMTVTAEFDAGVDRVWQLYADPRRLERWWGPPTYPATFVEHDLTVGSRCTYFMTGPEGDQHHGWWVVTAVEPPYVLEVTDGFADSDGNANDALPTMSMRVELSERPGGGTTVTITSRFGSVEQLQQLLDMGVEEGLKASMSQMDDLLAA